MSKLRGFRSRREHTQAQAFPWADWNSWLDSVEFGSLDKQEIIDNALLNVADLQPAAQFEGAKATVLMYIDQGVSSF